MNSAQPRKTYSQLRPGDKFQIDPRPYGSLRTVSKVYPYDGPNATGLSMVTVEVTTGSAFAFFADDGVRGFIPSSKF